VTELSNAAATGASPSGLVAATASTISRSATDQQAHDQKLTATAPSQAPRSRLGR
jgi:hypothetical protein